MRRKLLGKTGIEVSIVGLGCANLGLPYPLVHRQHVEDPKGHYMDLEVGIQTVIASAEAGCTLFDTAPKYGNTQSEKIVGEARIRQREISSRCMVTTKVGCCYPGDGFDHSYRMAIGSVSASLRRLGQRRLKILYLHDPMGFDRDCVMDGTVRAMKELRKEGIVEHLGLAANDPETTAEYIETGEFEVATVSGAWSLIDRKAEQRIIPAARKYGVGLVITTGLERGLLATGPIPGRVYLERDFSKDVLDRVKRMQEVSEEDFGIPLGAAALQWCTRIPEAASVIPGASNPEEAGLNASWGMMDIPERLWDELENVY